jgi:DNA replication protein DnaC
LANNADRAESWTHEEFLVACLQREVSARESHGGEGRIRAARFPSRKSLEEFDFDHARGLKRDLIAHLGTLDFVAARDTVVFIGPAEAG